MVLCSTGLSWKTFVTWGTFTDPTACKKVLWSEAVSGKLQLIISNWKIESTLPIYVVKKKDSIEIGKCGIFY